MKIVICPLVSRDIKRAKRAVKTANNLFTVQNYTFETVSIINSKNEEFITEFSSWCKENNQKYIITESNGTPAKGKNCCIDFFLNSNYDGLTMLDGDDIVYPTTSIQIARHLEHHPGTDIIIVKPSDQISNNNQGNAQISDTIYASLWGTHEVSLDYYIGPAQHELFENRHKSTNLGGHVFYSKRAASYLKYDETQLLGEDLLLEFEMLKLHQEGKIAFWLSFASDVQLLDRTSQNNIQTEYNQEKGDFYYRELVKKIPLIVDKQRSSFNELPVEFPPLYFSYKDKVDFIRNLHHDNEFI